MSGLTDFLTAIQNGVSAVNNLSQFLNQATARSSSLLVSGVITAGGVGLAGGSSNAALAVSLTTLTNSISSDISLNNTSSYFDGPVVAQGSSGKWLATGQVTVRDNAGVAIVVAKLWDGTTIIDSGAVSIPAAGEVMMMPLSGVITSPSGNIRISCKDQTSASGLILANQSGNAKDSTITVVRIG